MTAQIIGIGVILGLLAVALAIRYYDVKLSKEVLKGFKNVQKQTWSSDMAAATPLVLEKEVSVVPIPLEEFDEIYVYQHLYVPHVLVTYNRNTGMAEDGRSRWKIAKDVLKKNYVLIGRL